MSRKESLQDKLKQKLDNGDIDQEEYDNLMKKFEDLDLLGSEVSSKKNYSYSGSKTMAGGEINEPVRVSGRLHVTDTLTAPKFSVSGSASVDGSLTITGDTKISGSLTVRDEARFGDNFKQSGKLKATTLFLTQGGKVSGKLEVEDRVVSDEKLKVSGEIQAGTVQSTGSIHISGQINLKEGLIAQEFVSSGGSGTIGGSIEAENVEIAKRYRLRMQGESEDSDFDTSNLDSIPELGKFIGNMVTKFIPKMMGGVMGQDNFGTPKILNVTGSVKGNTLDLSYCVIEGDVVGDDIIIGPEVTINGSIKYSNTVTTPEGSDYSVEQIKA